MNKTLPDNATLEELEAFAVEAKSQGLSVWHRTNVTLREAEEYARDAVDSNVYDYQAEYEVKQ